MARQIHPLPNPSKGMRILPLRQSSGSQEEYIVNSVFTYGIKLALNSMNDTHETSGLGIPYRFRFRKDMAGPLIQIGQKPASRSGAQSRSQQSSNTSGHIGQTMESKYSVCKRDDKAVDSKSEPLWLFLNRAWSTARLSLSCLSTDKQR